MPYFLDPNLDEEQQDPSQIAISGASPTAEPGNSGNQPAGNKGLNTGSHFQNLDKYLQANQGQQFGQKLVGNVAAQVEGAKQGIGQGAQEFRAQVQGANSIPSSEQVNSAIANPSSVKPEDFQKWQTQSYSGPNSLPDVQGAFNKVHGGVSKASAEAGLLGSEPGRFTLLDSYFGRPNYNFGQKSLDNLLVQQSGIGGQTRAVQNSAAGLRAQEADTGRTLQNEAAQRAAEVAESAKGARGAIGVDENGQIIRGEGAGAIGKAQQEAADALIAQNAQRKSIYDKYLDSAGSSHLDQGQLLELGLNGNEKPYTDDLSKYFTPGMDLNINQTLTPEMRARIKALEGLAGVDDQFGAGEAGDKTDPFTFNREKFASDSAAAGKQYTDKAQAIVNKYVPSIGVGSGFDDTAMWQQRIDNTNKQLQNKNINESQRATLRNNLSTFSKVLKELTALQKIYTPGRSLTGDPMASISPELRDIGIRRHI